jgi:putative sterol carrier protein
MTTPFTSPWWDKVVDAWNASPHLQELSGLGVVSFFVQDADSEPVYIYWDNSGRAKRCNNAEKGCPSFKATTTHWLAFINAEFTATAGVLAGKLEFEGDLQRILPYSLAFNLFAQEARTIL